MSPEHVLAALPATAGVSDGTRHLRGEALHVAIDRRARALTRGGVRTLALAGDNGIDWVLWDLAALVAGVVCVPVPGFFSPQQTGHLLQSSGADTCLIADDSAAVPEERLAAAARPAPAAVALPPTTARITFTSGTTGQPRGVCLDAQGQLAVAQSLATVLAPLGIRRHLVVLPLAVLLENIAGVYAPLLAGAQVMLRPLAALGWRGSSALDVRCLLRQIDACGAESLITLPQMVAGLVAALNHGEPRPRTLRFVAVGGGRVAPDMLARGRGLGLPVYEGYGLSECASVVCLNHPGADRPGTVGAPLAHASVRIDRHAAIHVRRAGFLGYLDAPASGEWVDTGDLGHWDGHHLVIHGRRKHQFVTAYGRNVNPEWVEAELCAQPGIAQAWVHGEAMPVNAAVLVPTDPDLPDGALAAAVAAANDALPDYARIGRWQRARTPFSAADALTTANGRLRRNALLAHYRGWIDSLSDTALTED